MATVSGPRPGAEFFCPRPRTACHSDQMTESFYDLLGVSTDADSDEIQRAYRQRIKETHPDVSDDPDASEKTARIVEARDVLTDPRERERYDRLGHRSYVATDVEGASDDGSWSARAAADAAESGPADGGPTNARASAEERRRRERRARQDVDFGAEAGRSATSSTNRSASTRGTTAAASSSGEATAATGQRGRAGGGRTSNSATRGPPPWSDTSQGWAARSPANPPPGLATQTVEALREAPATAVVIFLLYPLLVLGTFLPTFPLLVNVIVGACLLAMVGAAQSVAGLGVAVYGTWSILGTVALVVLGTNPFSPLGLVLLGTTWLPLGFSILTYRVLDS